MRQVWTTTSCPGLKTVDGMKELDVTRLTEVRLPGRRTRKWARGAYVVGEGGATGTTRDVQTHLLWSLTFISSCARHERHHQDPKDRLERPRRLANGSRGRR